MVFSMSVVAVAETDLEAAFREALALADEAQASAQQVLDEARAALAEALAEEEDVTPVVVDTVAAGIVAISAPILPEGAPDVWAPLTYSDNVRPDDARGMRNRAEMPALLYPEAYHADPDAVQVFGGTFTVEVGGTTALRLPQVGLTVGASYPVGFTIMGGGEFISYENSLLRDGQTWDIQTWNIARVDADGVPYIDFFVTGVENGTVELVTRTPGITGLSLYRIVVGDGGVAGPAIEAAAEVPEVAAPAATEEEEEEADDEESEEAAE